MVTNDKNTGATTAPGKDKRDKFSNKDVKQEDKTILPQPATMLAKRMQGSFEVDFENAVMLISVSKHNENNKTDGGTVDAANSKKEWRHGR